ncbi:hypothetical protein [Persicitalea jodogahamensis]|uniref:Uncharacterized protein n=1 Tax=Persicitalea jodogahamensis TaxID=402147 RepID=A0A8J3D8R2_9BACT|nr:hypothetical protein [Persicitalea jodogahamensis]GHB67208.1 hypothetical protein GCM10007390_20630 [Persicitalea jodogahamensis]
MNTFSNSRDREIAQLRKEVNELKSELGKLTEAFKIIRGKVLGADVPMEITKSSADEQAVKPTTNQVSYSKPQEVIHTFYLSTPNADGSFNNSSANASYKEGASIYKFQNIKGNQAKFKIDEHEASVRLALAYPDKNIDPVCDASNAFDPKARKIYTEENGIAELVGDRWKVITKARIRYES